MTCYGVLYLGSKMFHSSSNNTIVQHEAKGNQRPVNTRRMQSNRERETHFRPKYKVVIIR